MSVYTVPALDAVNFALTATTPADITPYGIALNAYTPPSLSAVDFALTSFTRPTFQNVGFELLQETPPDPPDPEPPTKPPPGMVAGAGRIIQPRARRWVEDPRIEEPKLTEPAPNRARRYKLLLLSEN